ncbi:hypothetical protein KNO15_21900 [Leifsonia shinshuensis]|uniref:hypothetical protein n=1 Tax=Leifsonia shinshuensis TaxID=150026 RepID=UPI001F50B678|nr:hypothetical protein [Leifsonia shinshuensis]MCI0159364.1 hypothetical protein [Leifsonia shinshuensis]
MRSDARRVRRALAAGAVALALGLTGCAAGTDYATQTASTLQHGVLEVATAAQAGDLAGAQTKLAALAKLNDAALAKGEIGSDRHAAIESSIVAVRADLTQLQDQAEKERLQQQLRQLQQQQQKPDQKGKGKDKGKGGGEGGDG